MNTFIGLLRAVNVGGTGKLPMSDLKKMCESIGFKEIRTYIASGNVIFESEKSEAEVKTALMEKLQAYGGKAVNVLVRTVKELTDVLVKNPFSEAAPNRTTAIFLDEVPPINALDNLTGKRDEELQLVTREIYVHYGDGMANSKLKIPAAKNGTARNINTIAKLVAMATKA